MGEPVVCQWCGSTTDVALVRYLGPDGEAKADPICAECKATGLERQRVRVGRSRRPPPKRRWFSQGLVGRALIGLGIVVLLLGVALAATGRFADDEKAQRCREIPAGLICSTSR